MDLPGILNNEGWVIFFKVWCKSSFVIRYLSKR